MDVQDNSQFNPLCSISDTIPFVHYSQSPLDNLNIEESQIRGFTKDSSQKVSTAW